LTDRGGHRLASRIASPEEAVTLVADGDVVAVTGCLSNLVPEALCAALEHRFLETARPRGLTEVHLNIFGLPPGSGLDRFAHPGMTERMIGSSFAPYPGSRGSTMTRMLLDEEIEAFALPAGDIAGVFQATAAGQPGRLSRLGLGTYVDPRLGGGAINRRAAGSGYAPAKVVSLDGRDWLLYANLPIDVSLIAATRADAAGNVSFEDEPLLQSAVAQAMATRASGGTVIVQVREVVEEGELDPRLVEIPSLWTDLIVEVPDQSQFEYGLHPGSPAFGGSARLPVPPIPRPDFSADTIIARRAALEIAPGTVVNFGAGAPVRELPVLLAGAAAAGEVAISVDHGSLGGVNLGGLLTASHWNPTGRIDSNRLYDHYRGTGLDVGCLGIGEVDSAGNVNVARIGEVVPGIGGFIDIAEAARTMVFCGTLRRGGLEVGVAGGRPLIESEGRAPKFVRAVDPVCFSGTEALARGQRVLYVTERCVFELGPRGLVLTEVAPGLGVADIRAAVDCDFEVGTDCRPMPAAAFADPA